jgi:hypothetical protein
MAGGTKVVLFFNLMGARADANRQNRKKDDCAKPKSPGQ